MREKLIALSIVKKGDWGEIYQFLRTDRNLDAIDEIAASKLTQQLNCEAITLLDEAYPNAWHDMPRPPFVVFYQGNMALLKSKAISVIGGKKMSNHTSKVIRNVINTLPNDISVVSGFEIGVEVYSMRHAFQKIAIIASGFDVDSRYQKDEAFRKMREDDLILSELPPHVTFDLSAYYRSYHLIHELCDSVCVFELPSFDLRLKYLAYLTDIGKNVVVTPDVFKRNTSGGLRLVNRGAKLLLRPKNVLDVFKDV